MRREQRAGPPIHQPDIEAFGDQELHKVLRYGINAVGKGGHRSPGRNHNRTACAAAGVVHQQGVAVPGGEIDSLQRRNVELPAGPKVRGKRLQQRTVVVSHYNHPICPVGAAGLTARATWVYPRAGGRTERDSYNISPDKVKEIQSASRAVSNPENS